MTSAVWVPHLAQLLPESPHRYAESLMQVCKPQLVTKTSMNSSYWWASMTLWFAYWQHQAARPTLPEKAETKMTRARPSTYYFFSCFLVSSHPPSWPLARLSPGLPSLRRLSWETCCMARRMAFCTICLLAFWSFTSSGSVPGFSPRQRHEKEERS